MMREMWGGSTPRKPVIPSPVTGGLGDGGGGCIGDGGTSCIKPVGWIDPYEG